VNIEAVLLGTGALVLFGAAVIDAPYFFYELLRILICAISAFLASKYYGEPRRPLAWAFAAVALLFNPLVPFKMARSDWQVINVLTAVFFIVFLAYLNRKRLLPRANNSNSVSHILCAAEQGELEAQVRLAALYQRGTGVSKDISLTVYWYRRAADRGYAPAQTRLAVLYSNGLEVPQDYGLAAEWYRKATNQNFPYAEAGLAASYYNGQGVPRDYALAAYWYRRAAEQGLAPAQHNLGELYFEGQGVPRNSAEAAVWFRRAADQGYAKAESRLGLMYSLGDGVPKHAALAASWYRKAAEQGDKDAKAHFLLEKLFAEADSQGD
jgi:TPR repeat protein